MTLEGAKIPNQFEKLYHSILKDEKLVRRYAEYEWVLKEIKNYKDKRILDAGCGLSPLPFFFAINGARVFGIDVEFKFGSTEELAFYCLFSLYPQYKLNFLNCNLDDLPFRDNYFDYITCTSVLHNFGGHFRGKCLNEMIRVSKKYLLITVDFNYCPHRFSIDNKKLTLIKQKEQNTIKMLMFKKNKSLSNKI